MRNSIRKRRYKPKSVLNSNKVFLYNFAFISVIVEILIGAVLGIALCCGFVISFIVFKGNLLLSVGIFCVILIIAVFLVLLFRYIFLSVLLKTKEIEILEKILIKSTK
ncbi:hypothetical protein CCY99_06860 [Helicobacter sp. 16-1353]|uniref:hypothetical protein n=1 Tax=Helicobacter sp. 16-1353 TaxID=2004996 RepID=UPI000DCBE922|nr:hypothetical protein [Helicobacter sp. 16-1353]RAX52687.1 hypothetical protein CCY99_06860 [Helicobacter sp. 16-1353]